MVSPRRTLAFSVAPLNKANTKKGFRNLIEAILSRKCTQASCNLNGWIMKCAYRLDKDSPSGMIRQYYLGGRCNKNSLPTKMKTISTMIFITQ